MNDKEKLELIKRNTEEIISEEDFSELLRKNKSPTVYCGYEPNGPVHLGHFVTITKLIDLEKAGFKVIILLADIHGALDNCPWGVLEKRYKYYSSVIPLMFQAVSEGRLSPEKLIDLTSTNPRKIFHLPDQQNTYVLVDQSKTYRISKLQLFTKCNWTPFKNLEGRGIMKEVVLRARTVYQNGKFLGRPQGRVAKPI